MRDARMVRVMHTKQALCVGVTGNGCTTVTGVVAPPLVQPSPPQVVNPITTSASVVPAIRVMSTFGKSKRYGEYHQISNYDPGDKQ